MPHPIGIFDVGSNTVLLTCGQLDEQGQLQVQLECHDVARLSQDLKDGGLLHPEAKKRVLKIMKTFQAQARQEGIQDLRAAGTAAFRRARDGEEFAKQIEKELGIPMRILEAHEEAHYSFLSVLKDFGDPQESLGMIDIGGGSTELVFGSETQWFSLPMGTVRLLEKFVSQHPISDSEWEDLQANIRQILQSAVLVQLVIPKKWVAVAATPTALANLIQELDNYDPKRVHGFRIELAVLSKVVEKLRRLSIAQRDHLKGMPAKRAELLPLGGVILKNVMEHLGLEDIRVSNHGLRYGLLWEELEKV